jgi:hypothetical protein
MPNLNSYADQFHDWDRLLQAFIDNAEVLAPAEPQRATLEKTLAALRDLKGRQDSHAASRQEMTQEITNLVQDGREQARRLRGMVKGLLGTKNERLVQFRVAPIRGRAARKSTSGPAAPKPAPVSPTPADPAGAISK